MYPNFYYLFKDLFGLDIPFLLIINTFGFMVAMSFIAAHIVMTSELKRKEKDGLLKGIMKKQWIGKAFSQSDYIVSGVTGFIAGYKLFPVMFRFSELVKPDPQAYILSLQGSFIGGIVLGALSLWWTWYQDKQQRKPEPELKETMVHPYQNMGVLTVAAFVAGILGAKLFHILENLDMFYKRPMESIVSFSGLTFYGGLICGGIAVLYYANKAKIKPLYMLDAGGPAMMLAYGLGRIGCHVSGDGDWGIVNTAPKPGWMGWAPDWLWAYDYPNNVNGVCNPYTEGPMANIPCNFEATGKLIAPVFPTPLYEAIVCILLFVVLWKIRKRIVIPGVLFGIYLMMNGIERFMIEKIRVNTPQDFLGMRVTQAEEISVLMFLGGVALIVYAYKRHRKLSSQQGAMQHGTQIEQ